MKQLFLVLFLVFISCFKDANEKGDTLAAVGDKYLMKEDIKNIFLDKKATGDSVNFVKNYISDWVSQQLLLEKAYSNLREEEIKKINNLIEEYKTNIYVSFYLQQLSRKSIDTIVNKKELLAFYNDKKEDYKLTHPLIKVRYVHVLKNNQNFGEILKRFKRYNEQDVKVLDSLSLQMIPFYRNDSTWIQANILYHKIRNFTPNLLNKRLRNKGFYQVNDSDNKGFFLIKILDVLEGGEVAPIDFTEEYLKTIILNKRKKEFTDMLKREIVEEAISKNEGIIYE